MTNKVKTLAAVILMAVVTFSFTTIEGEKKEIKTDNSTVTWKGYKVTGSHYGTVALKSGHLVFDQGKLTGGEFEVDMTSIIVDDLEDWKYTGGNGVFDKFPNAKLVFTKVKSTGKNSYEVTGDLTVKGKSAPVTFEMSVYGNKATANVKVDRTTYDIRYKSASFFDDLKDKAIYDEFDLVTDLEF